MVFYVFFIGSFVLRNALVCALESKSTAKRLSVIHFFSSQKGRDYTWAQKYIERGARVPMAKRVFMCPILRAQHVDFCNFVFVLPWLKSPKHFLRLGRQEKTSLAYNHTGILIKNAKALRPGIF